MASLKSTMLNIVSGLSANMAADPIAGALIAIGAALLTGTPVTLSPAVLPTAATFGALFVGATAWQSILACRASKQDEKKFQRMVAAVNALRRQSQADHAEARQELAELALDQHWVREALEKTDARAALLETWTGEIKQALAASPVQADFYAGWQEETRAALAGLGLSAEQVQYALADISGFVRDTNERTRDLQVGQAKLLTTADFDAKLRAMEERYLAKLESLTPPGGPPGGGGMAAAVPERDLVAAVERVARDAAAGSMTARNVLERETPTDLAHYLDARRERLGAAQAALNARVNEEKIQLDRELAAVAYTTGQIDRAAAALRRILTALPDDLDALNRIGWVHALRGALPDAEAAYRRVLELADDQEWEAIAYGNLGLIERTRGNLDAAEAYLKKSLAIHEKLGRLEGMAANYGNLGLIEQTRGNLDAAEAYLKKSLVINEKLGRPEGMAIQYGNLGLIERTRGNLDAAEAYLKKSLVINEKLGRPEGMAISCFNLADIAEQRGDSAAAEALFARARDLYTRVGIRQWAQEAQRRLDALKLPD